MTSTSSKNFTGLYQSGAATVNPNAAYGNANVVSLLAAGTDGANTVTNISATGNVTAANFIGNLVGNITGNIVVTGSNTEVLFNNNGNIGAVPDFTWNSATNTLGVTGAVTATGNVTANYFVGNGSLLTGIATSSYGNANVATYLASGTLASNIVTSANISGSYILGNGSQLTGLPATYGNANVTTLLAGFGSNSISTTGNVTASYFAGDGSQLSNINAGNITGSYGNANVANFLANYGSNIISSTGNVTAGNVIAPTVYTSNITGAAGQTVTITAEGTNDIHLDADSVRVGDNNSDATITTHGTGDLILRTNEGAANQGNIRIYDGVNGNIDINPNGSGTVNIIGTGGVKVSDGVSATGNITGSYFLGNGSQLTGLPAAYGNADVATFLANFGSNTISTTGNITGGNFIGSGAALSSITGANVTGTVANATYALNANAATFAGTVTTAAQPNITSVGTLSSLTVTANITGGNLNTSGQVSATGNIRGNYYFGNGSQLTGITATIGPTISVTGNITGGNLISNGILSTAGNAIVNGNLDVGGKISVAGPIEAFGSQLTAGNIYGENIYAGGAGGNISASGNVTIGRDLFGNTANFTQGVGANTLYATSRIDTGGLISAIGNITGSYFFGNGSQLTGITTAVGGPNTAVQFNNAGVLGGSTKFAYDSTFNILAAGNIALGDPTGADTYSVIRGQLYDSNVTPNPGRIAVGPGYDNNYTNTYDPLSINRGSQLAVMGKYNVANTNTNQSARILSSTAYFDLRGGTLNNANRRLNAGGFAINIANGTATLTTGQSMTSFAGTTTAMSVGNVGGLGLGNATVSHAVGHYAGISVQGGGSVGNAIGVLSNPGVFAATGNITNYIGYGINQSGTTGMATPFRVFGVYNPDHIGSFGFSNSNTARAATNYYFLYNEDNVARSRMGSLETYTEFANQAATSSGTIDVNKNAGQVQQWNLTGNATLTVSNFVTSASDSVNTDYQSDTVTVIINQGSTGGYGVTFPTPSSVYKYAGNVTTLQSTAANSVTMVSITAVYMNSQTTYLFTISPGFV